jgi:hypothetical protein
VEESGQVGVGKDTCRARDTEDLLNSIKAPKDLLKAMQELLITYWWTIGFLLAILITKHLKLFLLLAKGVCKMIKTIEKESIIAYNLLPLTSLKWIVTNVVSITRIAKSWLNEHMEFYHGTDPNIWLSFHHQVLFFLMS